MIGAAPQEQSSWKEDGCSIAVVFLGLEVSLLPLPKSKVSNSVVTLSLWHSSCSQCVEKLPQVVHGADVGPGCLTLKLLQEQGSQEKRRRSPCTALLERSLEAHRLSLISVAKRKRGIT